MSERAQELASAFDRAADELVGIVRTISDEEWKRICPDENWSVGHVAHHIALWMEIEGSWMDRVANDKPVIPLAGESLAILNAYLVASHPELKSEDVLLEIAGNRSLMRHWITTLNDEQLAASRPANVLFQSAENDDPVTLEWLIERLGVGHIENHLQSIKSTIDS